MAVLTFSEMSELKSRLEALGCRLHIHDACGGQSFSLEFFAEENREKALAVLDEYFTSRKMTIEYYNKAKTEFTVK